MRALAILILAALAASGCGESRMRDSITGPGGPGTGGAPGNGNFSDCDTWLTENQCVGRGSRDVILDDLVVRSSGDVITLQLPIEYASSRAAQGVEVVLEAAGEQYPFLRPGQSCPVVPDMPGVDGVRLRDFGTVTGIPAGVYDVVLQHGLDNPCYEPPAGSDPTASNWVVARPGELVICTP